MVWTATLPPPFFNHLANYALLTLSFNPMLFMKCEQEWGLERKYGVTRKYAPFGSIVPHDSAVRKISHIFQYYKSTINVQYA